jgi:hypothetical protein
LTTNFFVAGAVVLEGGFAPVGACGVGIWPLAFPRAIKIKEEIKNFRMDQLLLFVSFDVVDPLQFKGNVLNKS